MDSTTTFAQDLKEMMDGWNTIMAAARRVFPKATEDELYRIAKGAMDKSLGLNK